jgi:hypothetical protein
MCEDPSTKVKKPKVTCFIKKHVYRKKRFATKMPKASKHYLNKLSTIPFSKPR